MLPKRSGERAQHTAADCSYLFVVASRVDHLLWRVVNLAYLVLGARERPGPTDLSTYESHKSQNAFPLFLASAPDSHSVTGEHTAVPSSSFGTLAVLPLPFTKPLSKRMTKNW